MNTRALMLVALVIPALAAKGGPSETAAHACYTCTDPCGSCCLECDFIGSQQCELPEACGHTCNVSCNTCSVSNIGDCYGGGALSMDGSAVVFALSERAVKALAEEDVLAPDARPVRRRPCDGAVLARIYPQALTAALRDASRVLTL